MNRIVTNQKILGGKPIIKGTRLSVEFILNLLASGAPEQEILADYPHIIVEDIHACLQYAANSLKNDIYIEWECV
ncbi:MAG: antitoxin [Bacteroidetes bacterium 4484_276]|nr:MAG: antitoxin [Bacteroidetes bacterium 4484_276]